MAKIEEDPLAEPDNGLLTTAEIEAAKAEARARWVKDAKAKAKKELIDIELMRLAREEGQRTGAHDRDEPCWVTIDLPEYATNCLINGEPFWHGHTYERPRHVVESLREQMFRAWNHQDDIDGKSVAQKLGRRRVNDRQYFGKGPTADPRFTFSAGQGAAQ